MEGRRWNTCSRRISSAWIGMCSRLMRWRVGVKVASGRERMARDKIGRVVETWARPGGRERCSEGQERHMRSSSMSREGRLGDRQATREGKADQWKT